MRRGWALALLLVLTACRASQPDKSTVVVLIESSPANLDPRVGIDAQSQRIDGLLFDGLVARTADFHFKPALATSWDEPNPLTIIFHLRSDVHFSDGRPLTARDVAWTFESMKKNVVISARTNTYASVASVEAVNPTTAVFHLSRPDNFLMANLSTGAIGIVPEGSGPDFWRHPVGTGPFEFVSQQLDQDVILARNPQSWSVEPKIARVRFAVVPDAITEALELEKGSGDVAINSLPMDTLQVLGTRANLKIEETGGTEIQYLAMNLRDPVLRDVRVRQALACAIDRGLIIRTLLRGHAQTAESLLPPTHWAWTGDVARYNFDPARANQLLDAAGFPRKADGVRFHLTMKTSTTEDTRLLAAVLQQQFSRVGIALDLRSYEFATFYADVTRGAFQMYSLRWIGGNEIPQIFNYVFATESFSPKGANRGHYSNAEVDRLLEEAQTVSDEQKRRADYVRVQQILAQDLPVINLWYLDTVIVHNRRLKDVTPDASGSYRFLETAALAQ